MTTFLAWYLVTVITSNSSTGGYEVQVIQYSPALATSADCQKLKTEQQRISEERSVRHDYLCIQLNGVSK